MGPLLTITVYVHSLHNKVKGRPFSYRIGPKAG